VAIKSGECKVFGISRGFRRLSVLVALTGFMVWLHLWFAPPDGPLFLIMLASLGLFGMALWDALFFVAAPAIFVLLVGWVVAGFRNPN
jgi:hypothetical protein